MDRMPNTMSLAYFEKAGDNGNSEFYGKQEKESIIRVRIGWKNPFLATTVCHH